METRRVYLALTALSVALLSAGRAFASFGYPIIIPVGPSGFINTPISTNGVLNGGWALVFDDEFNGTSLDTTTNWNSPPTSQTDSTYGGTYSPALTVTYMAGNVTVGSGCLSMAANWVSNTSYTTSGLSSKGSVTGPGVYWEARVKLPDPSAQGGLVSTFWADAYPSFVFPEIDTLEYSSHLLETSNGWNDGTVWASSQFTAIPNPYSNWHNVASYWTSSAITYYVDGVQTAQHTNNTNQAITFFNAILNHAVCGTSAWCNSQPSSSAGFPSYYLVDYIHVYKQGGTPITPGTNYKGPGDAVGTTTCTN
jgi:hypothetical protein